MAQRGEYLSSRAAYHRDPGAALDAGQGQLEEAVLGFLGQHGRGWCRGGRQDMPQTATPPPPGGQQSHLTVLAAKGRRMRDMLAAAVPSAGIVHVFVLVLLMVLLHPLTLEFTL